MPLTAKKMRDLRYKFAAVNVMIVDNDKHSAALIEQLLTSFGFRKIRIAGSGDEALKQLRSGRTDLIITEWATGDVSGLTLVRTIRMAKNDKLLSQSTPIIMLTARSQEDGVKLARDAGITEFLAKPFSAKTLSTRLIEIINKPREFVETATFKGPSRRRKEGPPPGVEDRRLPREERLRRDGVHSVTFTKPDKSLSDLIDGLDATDIITEDVILEAQSTLLKEEDNFIQWVKEDLAKLEEAYTKLSQGDDTAHAQFIRAAYTIKSQAGIFGYDMATLVADMLIDYLNEHLTTDENTLVVIRKHLDTLSVIITHQVKDATGHVGLALIDSLNKLIAKFR